MGDLNNAFETLERALKKVGIILIDDHEDIRNGKPSQIIALVRKLMLSTSTSVAKQMLLKGCPSHATDKKLAITAFDILRENKQAPNISVDQFFSQGFVFHKLNVLSKLAEYVSSTNKTPRPTTLSAFVTQPDIAATNVFGDYSYASSQSPKPYVSVDSSASDWPLSDFIRQHIIENKVTDAMTRKEFKKTMLRGKSLSSMAYVAEQEIIAQAAVNANNKNSAFHVSPKTNKPSPSSSPTLAFLTGTERENEDSERDAQRFETTSSQRTKALSPAVDRFQSPGTEQNRTNKNNVNSSGEKKSQSSSKTTRDTSAYRPSYEELLDQYDHNFQLKPQHSSHNKDNNGNNGNNNNNNIAHNNQSPQQSNNQHHNHHNQYNTTQQQQQHHITPSKEMYDVNGHRIVNGNSSGNNSGGNNSGSNNSGGNNDGNNQQDAHHNNNNSNNSYNPQYIGLAFGQKPHKADTRTPSFTRQQRHQQNHHHLQQNDAEYEAKLLAKLEVEIHKRMETKIEQLVATRVAAAVEEVTQKYDFIINKLVAAVDAEFTLLNNQLKFNQANK